MDIIIVIVLCLLGIVLILIEIFLIPGITIAGIAGGLFAVGAIYYAFSHLGVAGGTIALIFSLILFGIAFVYLVKSKALDTIALKTNIQSTVASGDALKINEGDEGISISRLNPMGKVKINDIVIEAKSLGEFINEETAIVVVKVSPTQLIVKTK
jgi:membrane-bound ClpP family serine protease